MRRSRSVAITTLAAAAAVLLAGCDDPKGYYSQEACRASSDDDCEQVAVDVPGGGTDTVYVPRHVYHGGGSFYYPRHDGTYVSGALPSRSSGTASLVQASAKPRVSGSVSSTAPTRGGFGASSFSHSSGS